MIEPDAAPKTDAELEAEAEERLQSGLDRLYGRPVDADSASAPGPEPEKPPPPDYYWMVECPDGECPVVRRLSSLQGVAARLSALNRVDVFAHIFWRGGRVLFTDATPRRYVYVEGGVVAYLVPPSPDHGPPVEKSFDTTLLEPSDGFLGVRPSGKLVPIESVKRPGPPDDLPSEVGSDLDDDGPPPDEDFDLDDDGPAGVP